MTDLLALLLAGTNQEERESAAGALKDALQPQAPLFRERTPAEDGDPEIAFALPRRLAAETGAGSLSPAFGQEESGGNASPAPRLEAEYTALRQRTAPEPQTVQSSFSAQSNRETGGAAAPVSSQRLIIKEPDTGGALSPTDLDRLFERDARRYDNGFTLY